MTDTQPGSRAVPTFHPAAPPRSAPSFSTVPLQPRRAPAGGDETPLVAATGELRAGWQRIKAGFVDNPRGSVAEAAGLVEEAAEMLIATLRERQQAIRDTWDGDGPASDTEDLRLALLRYQSLFDRLSGG